jgi:hypothetical protein
MRTLFTAEHLAAPMASGSYSQLPCLTAHTDGRALLTWHCYCMPYVEHYCLVPHPMAVLGRKRMYNIPEPDS